MRSGRLFGIAAAALLGLAASAGAVGADTIVQSSYSGTNPGAAY
jgi:hypothetical protein